MRMLWIVSVMGGLACTTWGDVPASGSVERGRTQFATCAACHQPGQKDHPGPDLRGVVGRQVGTLPGFRYSRALRTAKLVWSPGLLDQFLADPQAVLPGNGMPFPGVPDPGARADLIAYLGSLK